MGTNSSYRTLFSTLRTKGSLTERFPSPPCRAMPCRAVLPSVSSKHAKSLRAAASILSDRPHPSARRRNAAHIPRNSVSHATWSGVFAANVRVVAVAPEELVRARKGHMRLGVLSQPIATVRNDLRPRRTPNEHCAQTKPLLATILPPRVHGAGAHLRGAGRSGSELD